MKKIVLATNNPGKIKEIQAFFQNLFFEIIPYNGTLPEETGLTFIENALLKARFVSQQTNLPALADDSGLVIQALNGRPGIYSARYAGLEGDASNNIRKVLSEMENIPVDKRQAYFYCAMALLRFPDDPAPLIATGLWSGSVLKNVQGENGFGYDPIFYVQTENCSAAELSLSRKNQISHRAKALLHLIEQIHEF